MEEKAFTLISRYMYSSEALIVKAKLESEGIDAFLQDVNTIDSNPLYSNLLGGIKLFVKTEDAEKAKEILNQISPYSFDDNHELIKCPRCGEKQIEMVTSIKDLKSFLAFLFSILIVFMPFYTKYKYKCQSCKFEFN